MPHLMARFRTSERGGIVLMFGLMLTVFVITAGGAIDYATTSRLHQDLKAAGDAAVLAAANEGRLAFLRGEVKTTDDLEALVKDAIEARFEAKVGGVDQIDAGAITPQARVAGREIQASINFAGESHTSFLKLIGIGEMRVAGKSRAIVNLPSYYHISLILDISASMGIGATLADQEIIANQTNCAFACHIGDTDDKVSGYEKSRDAGAVNRLDVARNAAINAIDALEAFSEFPDQVSFSVHTFDDIPYEVIGLNDPRATDFSYVKSKLNESVFMNVENGGTNIEHAMSTVAEDLPRSGTGLSPDDRIQYAIVLTDGVEDSTTWDSGAAGWARHPLADPNDPYKQFTGRDILYAMHVDNACSTLRSKNISTFFLYVEYEHPAYGKFSGLNVRRFEFIEDVLFDLIPKRFLECVGNTGRVIKADSPAEIRKAFGDLIKELLAPLRLS